MRSKTRVVVLSAVLMVGGSLVLAKGPTIRITVAGPGLSRPIEVTDRAALEISNVWSGSFAAWASPAPRPASARSYELGFHSQLPDGTVKLMYVVSYLPRDGPRGALICLPGPGEKYYRLNTGTIYRENEDGSCFPVAEPLERALVRALARQKRHHGGHRHERQVTDLLKIIGVLRVFPCPPWWRSFD